MLESKVDSKIVNYARDHGVLVIKLAVVGAHGESGWPDRMFLKTVTKTCPHCLGPITVPHVVFMEMKSTDGKSTPKQEKQQERLAAAGFTVYRDISDPEVGKQLVFKEFLGA